MRTGFTVEQTFQEAPLRISRARHEDDRKTALLFEIPGATLSPTELDAQRAALSWLLSLQNSRSGLSFAWEESGTPLCGSRQPLGIGEFLPLALNITEALGQQLLIGSSCPIRSATLLFVTAPSSAPVSRAARGSSRFCAPGRSGFRPKSAPHLSRRLRLRALRLRALQPTES